MLIPTKLTLPVTLTLTPSALAKRGLIHPSWVEPLTPVQPQLDEIASFLQAEQDAGRGFLPDADHLLRAFHIPFDEVRVVIVGQDPYPTLGHPIGLSFAVAEGVRPLPRSLVNILRELSSDLDVEQPQAEILHGWADQGVMLLNRVLSVRPGHAGSHRKKGWEAVTECTLRALDARASVHLVAVLWGNDAQTAVPFLSHAHIIASVHPSPLSASRGFFGSKPFSKVNEFLSDAGESPVNWA